MTNQRWKWDAEAAFKSVREEEEGPQNGEARTLAERDAEAMKAPYTPPPNVAAWLKAQADKPKPHGRDIESLMRYHKAHERDIGYWEDAPRGMKFVAKPTRGDLEEDCFSNESDAVAACRTGEHVEKMPDGTFAIYPDSTCPKCGNMMVAGHYCSTGGAKFGGGGRNSVSADVQKPNAAPTTTPPADGLWPKCLFGMKDGKIWACAVYTSNDVAVFWWNNKGITTPGGAPLHYGYDFNSRRADMTTASTETAIAWLEQNGHADVAAQLRGKVTAGAEEFEPVGTKVQIGDRITARIDMGSPDGIGAFTVAHINEHGVFGPDENPCLTSQDYIDAGKRRILKRKPTAQTVAVRAWEDDGYAWAQIGGVLYSRVLDGQFVQSVSGRMNYIRLEWEKFGPERDAIVAECCAAMKLDPKTGEPINK